MEDEDDGGERLFLTEPHLVPSPDGHAVVFMLIRAHSPPFAPGFLLHQIHSPGYFYERRRCIPVWESRQVGRKHHHKQMCTHGIAHGEPGQCG